MFSKQYFEKLNENVKRKAAFKSKQSNFPNPPLKQTSKASFVKGNTDVKKILLYMVGG